MSRINNVENVNIAGAASETFIARPPAIDIQQANTIDLQQIAYHRADPPYDQLLAALLAKVAELKEELRVMSHK